jgi:hypothetical protein
MTTASAPSATPKIRLYLDDGKTNPEIDTKTLKKCVLGMFIHWVNSGRHERDFVEAMSHTATGLYADYLLLGSPVLPEPYEEIPDYVPPPVAALVPAAEQGKPRPRFYDDEGNLTPGINTEPYRLVLLPFLYRWVAANYHQREFIQAVSDVAISVYHDYTISCSMGGLGGCKTRDEFLSISPEL